MRAWVPTTISISPDANFSLVIFLTFSFRLPIRRASVMSLPDSIPSILIIFSNSPSSRISIFMPFEATKREDNVWKCCSAKTSVGAIKADCLPDETAVIIAAAATTVLPLPTSPCKSLPMAVSLDISLLISPITFC